jgi:hypothetical protein
MNRVLAKDKILWPGNAWIIFSVPTGVKTKPGAKIKWAVAMALHLGGADHMFANHPDGEAFGLE